MICLVILGVFVLTCVNYIMLVFVLTCKNYLMWVFVLICVKYILQDFFLTCRYKRTDAPSPTVGFCSNHVCDLIYKLRRVKGEANFISSGSKIVKRLRRRQYDPVIIERTIGLVFGPFTALYRSFLKHCTLTNKAVGTIWRALPKPPLSRQGPDPRPPLIVSRDYYSLWTWACVQTARSTAYLNGRH